MKNYKKIFLVSFILLFLISNSANADVGYSYAKTVGGTGADIAKSVFLDSSNNIYITGSFSGTVDFDPSSSTAELTSNGSTDIFILKLDSTGAFSWVKQVGGSSADSGNAVTVDSSGNIYVAGSFIGATDFDPGAGTSSLTGGSNGDAFILKLDSNGDFSWAKNMGGNSWNAIYSIAVDTNGIYTTGLFAGTTDFDPGAGTANLTAPGGQTYLDQSFILKLDLSGNYSWAKSIGGSQWDTAYSLALDSSGNVYITGYFESTADFDPGAGTANLTASGDDIFVLKLDSSGTYVWAKKMGGSGSDIGMNIAVDTNGNVYTAGYFNGTADFDPGAGTANLTSAGSRDLFISKLDSTGVFSWVKQVGGSDGNDQPAIGNSLFIDNTSGAIYLTGSFIGTVDFDPGAGTANLISGGSTDTFILKLDSSANYVYAKGLSGSGADSSNGLYVDTINEIIYTVGQFSSTVDFDPSLGTSNATSLGSTDIFLSVLAPDTTAPEITSVSVSNIAGSSAIVSWQTNEVSSTLVEYGKTSSLGSTTTETDITSPVTTHSVSLTDLNSCSDYSYRVKSTDQYSNVSYSSVSSFSMPGCGVIPISILQSISATAQNQNINQPISQQQNVQTINQPPLQQQNDQIKIDNNLNQNNSPKEEITDNFKFNKTLKFGVRDDSVVELQKFLNNNGFLVSKNGAGSPGKETKYFGFYTRKALIDFQKSNNIKPANGYLGSATIKKINNFK